MTEKQPPLPWLRPTIEYGPAIIFFVAYYFGDLFVATAAIMAATAVALALSYIVERRLPVTPLATAAVVGVFGGLTLWLQDKTFIKMKPTIIQSIFGCVLFLGLMGKRLFLKTVLGAAWPITDQGWRILTIRLTVFFFFSAALNEVIWRTQSTDFWVNFKVFGLVGLTFLFFLGQLPLLKRYAIEESSAQEH